MMVILREKGELFSADINGIHINASNKPGKVSPGKIIRGRYGKLSVPLRSKLLVDTFPEGLCETIVWVCPHSVDTQKARHFFPVGLPENRGRASRGLAKVRRVRTVKRARSGERLSGGGRTLYPGVSMPPARCHAGPKLSSVAFRDGEQSKVGIESPNCPDSCLGSYNPFDFFM